MSITPTGEQLAITARVTDTSDGIAVYARAGAAKTTTLTLIAQAMPGKDLLALAFNKKIADEMRERLPAWCESRTINSLGNEAWKNFRGKPHKIDDKKMFELLSAAIKRAELEDQDALYERFSDLLRVAKDAKQVGYLPPNSHNLLTSIITGPDFYGNHEIILGEVEQALIDSVLRASVRLAFDGMLDFGDQIYLPALCRSITFPRRHAVLVDEAQDLSPLNHALLRKIAKGARLIIVGDPCQAIYGFRGADEESMRTLSEEFNLASLYLTVCFRSGENIVRNAQWRAPDMQWWPATPPGLVQTHDKWQLSQLLPGDAIICRNNAPLFYIALSMLRSNLKPELLSGDIIPGLVKIMKKLGKPSAPTAEARSALKDWTAAEQEKNRSADSIADRASCIELFLDRSQTLGEATGLLEAIANMTGSIKLMTGHKSKGLEFDRVWFLDRDLCRPKGQDLNVRYVIETRARRELHYITSQGLTE